MFLLFFGPCDMGFGPEDWAVSWCTAHSSGCICGCSSKRFSKEPLSLCGYIHHGSVTGSQAVPTKNSKITHIQQWFPLLAGVFETFCNIMYHRWWNTYILCSEMYSLGLIGSSLMRFGTNRWTPSDLCVLLSDRNHKFIFYCFWLFWKQDLSKNWSRVNNYYVWVWESRDRVALDRNLHFILRI